MYKFILIDSKGNTIYESVANFNSRSSAIILGWSFYNRETVLTKEAVDVDAILIDN